MRYVVNLGLLAAGVLCYTLVAAAVWGYFERRGFIPNSDYPTEAVPILWPVFLAVFLLWALFVKPVVPVIVGVHRLAAGKTWKKWKE